MYVFIECHIFRSVGLPRSKKEKGYIYIYIYVHIYIKYTYICICIYIYISVICMDNLSLLVALSVTCDLE